MFYTIDQNNSGGYFIMNDEVTQYVIVEANSSQEAEDKLNDIVEDYSEFCPCCGERWDFGFYEEQGKDEPMIYGTPIHEVKKGMFREECIIYYIDGRKEKVVFKD